MIKHITRREIMTDKSIEKIKDNLKNVRFEILDTALKKAGFKVIPIKRGI